MRNLQQPLGEAGAHIRIRDKKFCGKWAADAKESYRMHLLAEAKKILVATTQSLEGYRIVAYHGTVYAACVDALTGYSDTGADIADFLGLGDGYEARISKLHRDAEDKLRVAAAHREAHAVVGTRFDFEFIESVDDKSLIRARDRKVMVAAVGTAVSVEPIGRPRAR